MSPLYFNLDMLHACDVILSLEFPTPRLLQGPAVSPFRRHRHYQHPDSGTCLRSPGPLRVSSRPPGRQSSLSTSHPVTLKCALKAFVSRGSTQQIQMRACKLPFPSAPQEPRWFPGITFWKTHLQRLLSIIRLSKAKLRPFIPQLLSECSGCMPRDISSHCLPSLHVHIF